MAPIVNLFKEKRSRSTKEKNVHLSHTLMLKLKNEMIWKLENFRGNQNSLIV